jgi:hypothetical protein
MGDKDRKRGKDDGENGIKLRRTERKTSKKKGRDSYEW